MAQRLANSLPFDKPYVLIGHSLGGMVAVELTRAIVRAGSRLPSHLIVSGCPAPQIPLARRNRHRLNDEELVAHLRALGGTPDEVLSNRELLELALPVKRADFKIADHYTYEPGQLLPVPITAYGGDSDTEVTENMVAAWRTQTSSTYTQRMFAGGHFFIQQSEDVVLAEVWQELSRIRSPVSLSGTPGMRHTS